MKKSTHLIAEDPCRQSRVATTIGIDLGDVWSHYCTINQDSEVVDRGRFRRTPKVIEVYGLAPRTYSDGSWDTFDLDRRTVAKTGP